MPVGGTRCASMPEREPIHAQEIERSRRRAATARPGLVWPPVPPPAMTISTTIRGAPRPAGPQPRDGLRRAQLSEARLGRRGPQPRDGLQRAQPQSPRALALVALEGELDQAIDQIGV